MELKNKVAIVTGASSGIGLATAQLLNKEGAIVVLVSRNKEVLEKISATLPNSIVLAVDLRAEDDARKIITDVYAKFNRIDIIVNNAGRGYSSLLKDIDTTTVREIFELNVIAPVAIMQEVIPIMVKQGAGAIVNVDSGTALMAIPGISAYSSSKRALVGFSLTAREELKKDNIAVSVVYPYLTATNFSKNTIGIQGEQMPSRSEMPLADSAEYVAQIILKAIETGEAELYAHEWMKEQNKKK